MGRLRCGQLWAVVASFTSIIAISGLSACGGHRPAGPSTSPTSITLTPSPSISEQLGNAFALSATAQNDAGSNIPTTFTFESSDSSILNISPGGIACAGNWNAPSYTVCTPGAVGTVTIIASALGASSPPTTVYVHPHIDNITVSQFYTTSPPPTPLPCVPLGKSVTLQATALSQNSDITASVGPFTWSAAASSVVRLTPIVNTDTSIATNQVTALATAPGITQIFASVNGVSSSAYVQPLADTKHPDVPLDFFESCPVQSITLTVGPAGSQDTTFAVTKGSGQTVTATVTDIYGNILDAVPLTWSSSEPASVTAPTSCTTRTCTVTTTQPGSGTITASCTPPTCNVGFPIVPAGLAFPDMQPFVPVPVYASTAVSGVINGASTASSVLATSLDCQSTFGCSTSLYNIPASTHVVGIPSSTPDAPNSLKFDLSGAKAYIGSTYGAQVLTPANLGTSTSAFSTLGAVTGTLLAISPNGNTAIFSDTIHIPNQVFVVNATTTSPSITPLNISGATVAAFSMDGAKAYILGDNGASLYIYSALQSLQKIPTPLTATAQQIVSSANGAFAFVTGATTGTTPAITAFNLCDNQVSTDSGSNQQVLALPAAPRFVKTIPVPHLEGLDDNGHAFADGFHILILDSTGIEVVTSTSTAPVAVIGQPAANSCPQQMKFLPIQHLELGQGTFDPLNFFVSPDATKIYVVARDRSLILVYDFNTASVSGIPLANDAVTGQSVQPLSADMSTDRTVMFVAGSDGALHDINIISAQDESQATFPDLPNLHNAFCNVDPSTGPCLLDFVAVKP